MRLWGVLGAALCVAVVQARAEIREMLDYAYYEVPDPAQSEMSLREALDSASPITEGERKLHGYNRWTINWHLEVAEQETSCGVDDVTVDLDTLMQLPALVSEDDELQQSFNDYVEKLQRHLVGHYVVAIQAVNKIELQVSQLPPAENCEALEQQVDILAESIVSEHREKARAFDEMTDYGAEQGVSLPD